MVLRQAGSRLVSQPESEVKLWQKKECLNEMVLAEESGQTEEEADASQHGKRAREVIGDRLNV